MARHLELFAVALVTILMLDALWLGVLMRRFYSSRFAAIGRMSGGSMSPIWPAAALVYVLLAVGVVGLALPQASGNVAQGAAWGALLGGVVYGVYNLTNHATLAGWSPAVTAVDLTWGTALCAVCTGVVTAFDRWIR